MDYKLLIRKDIYDKTEKHNYSTKKQLKTLHIS